MKVKICFNVYVDENYRRALRHRYGEKGLATRKEIREFIESAARSMDEDLMDDYQRHLDQEQENTDE